MTARELLEAYRAAVMELQEMELLPGELLSARITEQCDRLKALTPQTEALLSCIEDARTYLVIRMYYQQGLTDAAIAQRIHISVTRVNQIRNAYVRTLTG